MNEINRDQVEKFAAQISANNETFEYVFTEATASTLAMAGEIWKARGSYGINKKVVFVLDNLRADKEEIIKRFEGLPSIILRINGEVITNHMLNKEDEECYYEGPTDKMLIYNKINKSKFIGKVKSGQEPLPHGQGVKIQYFTPKEQTMYQGQFEEGKKCGYGQETRKYYRYEGQWEHDLKNGIGVEYLLRKKKKVIPKPVSEPKTEASSDMKIAAIKEDGQADNSKQQKSEQSEQNEKDQKDEEEEDKIEDLMEEMMESSNIPQQAEEIDQNLKLDLNELNGYIKDYKVVYNGPFEKGVRSGDGGIEWSKNGKYEGRWENGQKNGHGKMLYVCGAAYEGNWTNNVIEGEGKYHDVAKSKYEGHFQNGNYDGEGTMNYLNGDSYSGMWSKGRKHGKGTYTYADGDYYDGDWIKDEAYGAGDLMTNGQFFQGEFKRGMKDGLGELTDENGDVVKGIWKKNQL